MATKGEANTLLEMFIPRYNTRFSKVALKEGDLHRRLPKGIKFRDILCIKAKRTIGNDYTIRWRGRRFLIDNASLVMRGQKVEVREHLDSQITIKFKQRYLDYHEVYETQQVKDKKAKKDSSKETKRK
ncbi:hypothetical protein ACFLRM_02575, partial [Acidobacteriota bacterium]